MKTPVPGVMQIHHINEAGQAAAASGAPPPTARKVVPATTTNPLHHPSSVAAAPTTFAQQQQSRLMRIPPFDVNSSEMIRAIVVVMKAIRPDASTATEVKEAVHTALLSFQPVSDVYNAYEDGSCYRPRQPVGPVDATPVAQPGGVSAGQVVKAVDPVDMVSRFPFLVPGGIVELVNLIMESIDRADDADIAVKCAEGQTSTMTRLAATALMVCEEARQHWKRAHANVIRDMLPFIRTAQAVVVLGSGQLLGKILARGAMECVRFYILEGSPELPAERMRRRERDRDAGVYSSAHHNDEEDASDFDSSISSNTAIMRAPMPMTARGAPSDMIKSPMSPLSSGSPRGPAAHHVPSSNNHVSSSPFVHGWSEDLVVRGRGSGVNLLNEVQYQAAKLCGLLPNKGEQLSAEDQERLESVRLRIFKSCVIVPDSLMASVLGMSDFSLVGAYGVTESGGIVHRSGSYQLALLSKALNKPLYVACESFKFTRETHCYPAASSDIAQPQTLQEEEERAVLSTHFCNNNDIATTTGIIPAPTPAPAAPVAAVPTPKVAAKSAPSRTGAAAANRPKGKSISSAPTAVVVAPPVPVPVAAPFVPSFTPSSEMSATVALGLTLGVQPSSSVADQLRKSIRREATESPIVCNSPVSLSPSTEPLALPAAATATSTASKATAARRGKGNTATPSLKVDLTGQASPKKGSSPQTTPAKTPSTTTTTSSTTRRMNVTLPSSSSSTAEPPQSPTTRKKFKSFHSSSVHMIDRMEDDALAAEGSIGNASNTNNTGGTASSSSHHHSDPTSSSQKSASAGRTKLSGGGGGGGGMGPRSVSHSHFSVTDTTSRGRTTGAGNSGGGGGAGSGGSGSSFRAGGGFAFIQSPFLHSTSKSDLTSLGGSMGASGMFPGTPASGMQGMFPQSSSNEFVRSLTDNTRGGGGSGSGGGGSSSVGGTSPEMGGGAFTAGGGLSGCSPQGEDGSPMMMMTTSTKGAAASIAYLGFTQPWDSKRAPPPMLELVPNDLITLFFTDKALMPPAGIVHHFYNTTGNKWWSSVVKPASQ